MATENILSTQLANRDALPQLLNDPGNCGGFKRQWIADLLCTTGKTSPSTYRFFTVPSNLVISSLKLSTDALSTSVTVEIGVYNTTIAGGAAVSAGLFGTGISCSSQVIASEERFNALAITTAGQQLWQLLALASDPGTYYDIVVTSQATITAGGNIMLDLTGAI